MRHEEINVCKECHAAGISCTDSTRCVPVRRSGFRQYNGIRFTADGFDCALPVTIDSHSVCSYECKYCFSDNLVGHQAMWDKQVGRTSLKTIEGIFSGESTSVEAQQIRQALKYDRRNAGGYPCAVQLGGLCDPCDSIEQNDGWLLEFLQLAIKYKQPVRLSTKGAIFLLDEYFDVVKQAPHLFWVAFSIICNDDDLLRRVDVGAPDTTTRLKAMKRLSDIGVNTSLRFRPIIPGISDYKKGHLELIARAAAAGARAVSYEVIFYPLGVPKESRRKWHDLNKLIGFDLRKQYASFGKLQACTRPAASWTEGIMHAIRDAAHAHGMVVGVSDPVWKQLTDTGCCCGILPDHPVFGNWERENATNAIYTAMRGNKELRLKDIVPAWAYVRKAASMVNMGAGPLVVFDKRHATWANKLEDIWDNPSKERSPYNYFQGAVVPDRVEDGHIVYKYKGLQRQHKKTNWNI